MAEIDITELFTDPDFVDEMTVVNRFAQVSTLGENFMKETVLDTVGSIQPADAKTVSKLPEALQVENLYSFWFKGQLVTSGLCRYPSVITFKGLRYQIQTVADWTNWGQGWVEGTCVAEVPA